MDLCWEGACPLPCILICKLAPVVPELVPQCIPGATLGEWGMLERL